MSYRGALSTLLFVLLAWMLLVAAACGLLLLEVPPAMLDSRPIRTRPPLTR